MQTFHRYILLLVAILCGIPFCQSQEQDPLNTSVVFSRLTIEDGLSSNTVRALLQDRMGFVWMGTSRGLNRFDGHSVLAVNKTRSLSVTSMVEDGDTIWVGTENGLFLYLQRTDSIQKFKMKSPNIPVENLNISDMKKDEQGHLWLATMGQGILRLVPQSGALQRVPTPHDARSYGCVYVNRKGEVWAASNWERENLIHYNPQTRRFEGFHLQFPDDASAASRKVSGIAMTEDKSGKMWFGMWDGTIVSFDAATRKAQVLLPASNSQMYHIHSMMAIEKNFLLMGSDKGLTLVNTQTGHTRLHTRDGALANTISDNFVYPLLVDREGGTWVGTYYGGVNYTHPVSGNFVSCTHSLHGNSVSGNVINHFCEDRYNRLWIASDDGGLCYYDPATGNFTPVKLADGRTHNVHALCMDGDLLYVGTYTQGIDIVNVNTLAVTHVPVFVDEKGVSIDASSYAIFSDRQHRIWVGTFDEVAIFHPDTRTFSDVKKVDVPVLDIQQDHTGCVWVATDGNGLWAYGQRGEWKHYLDFNRQDLPDGASVSIYNLFEDGSGTLWAATANGLFQYDRDADVFTKVHLTAQSIGVYGITAVEGKLWLSTSTGIICYSLTDQEVLHVYKGGGNITNIDFLPSAIFRGYDGHVYIGTTSGFIAFMPQFMHRNEVRPQVVFTGLDIFNRPVPVGSKLLPQRLPYMKELRLTYRETVFRVSFSAMSFLQPSDILYSYQLEGFDENWTDIGNQQNVTYTNLSPGTYTLHVRACINDGILSDDATLRIVITPPFYWNTPAQLLYLALIICLVTFYVRHLLTKKEREHVEEIREINTQKEQEIQEINIQKEQEIQEINIQKEQEIQEINIQKEQEVHDARIKFMTINDRDQAFLDKMETVIEQNFSNSELSVDYLASELSVSRSGLFSKIKALADITPNEMIQIIRLKHAASLLLSGNYRVNEVCYMVGFSSPSYFAKCFQKQYGCTPAKYKG